jgi:serine/threonine-protein kinase
VLQERGRGPLSTDPRIGTEIAGYRIEARIGRGGMATVYLAEHLRPRRRVALKILDPELAADTEFRNRFERESQLAASLEHPNIIPVYDAGESVDVAYIAMRYVQGRDLSTVLEEDGRLETAQCAEVVAQIADALDAAHGLGLVHRDVKPGNIVLQGDRAYLTDFGLTKRLDAATVNTDTGRFLGTIAYAAPEQFEGRPLDARTDQYSLACVAFHCLTGRRPYPADQEAAVMFAHLRQPPPRVHDLLPDLPPALDGVIGKGMAKAKEDRYPSCRAFAEALDRSLMTGTPAGQKRRSAIVAVAGLVAIAAAAALAISTAARGGDDGEVGPSPSPRSSASASTGVSAAETAIVSIDVSTYDAQRFPTEVYPTSITVGEGAIWFRAGLGLGRANQLGKLNPATGIVVDYIQEVGLCLSTIGVNRHCAAAGLGSVWTVGGIPGEPLILYRVDPLTNEVVDSHRLARRAGSPTDITIGAGDVWVSAEGGVPIFRYSPVSDEVTTIQTGGSTGSIAFGDGFLWVVDPLNGVVHRIDARSSQVTGEPIAFAGSPDDVAVGGGYVWISDYANDEVIRMLVSASPNFVSYTVGDRPGAIAFGADAVWVANSDDTVSRIDQFTGEVTSILVGGIPGDVAFGGGRIWLTTSGSERNLI